MWSRSLLSRVLSRTGASSRRHLNLQEYQSKELLREAGVQVQPFVVVDSGADARRKLEDFCPHELVVKAMVLAGGRGKGTLTSGIQGGVKLTKDPKEAVKWVEGMIGYNIITKQTPKDGVPVHKELEVMIAESVDLKRETYVAILLDRDAGGPVIVSSPAGGMDIEEVAEKQPHLIFKEPIDIMEGLTEDQALKIADTLEYKGEFRQKAAEQIKKLYQLFLSVDASQIEINPMSETGCNRVFCIDAKLNFDDAARFRQERIFALDDGADTDPRELAASKSGLNFISLDGNIACLVNGAGLAMATMDIIKLHGGEPANFLDVGGSVNEAAVSEAFRIISDDPNVKAILVNVFAGIVNCVTIANGIVAALEKTSLSTPLIVRLAGNNAEAAREILANSGLPITTATDLDDAALKSVAAIS